MENRLENEHHDLAHDEEDDKKIYRAGARAARASKRFVTRSFSVAHQHRRSHRIRSLQSLSFRIHSIDTHSLRRINLLVFFLLAVKQATGELPVPIIRSQTTSRINSQGG